MASQFSKIKSSSNFFDVVLFLLSSLVTRPSFMPISSLALELWSFPFIRDWPEIRKWEIPPSEICPMSGDWGELGIPNLARTSLTKCYWMLQNSRVTTLSVSELLRKNQQGIKLPLPPPPPRVKYFFSKCGQIRRKPRIWSNSLKKSLIENFIFSAVFLEDILMEMVTHCAIWYHLYNFKKVKNTHGGMLPCNFTKSNTPPWVFFTFFELCKWWHQSCKISRIFIEQYSIDKVFFGTIYKSLKCLICFVLDTSVLWLHVNVTYSYSF